jgi:hypothetical protein
MYNELDDNSNVDENVWFNELDNNSNVDENASLTLNFYQKIKFM